MASILLVLLLLFGQQTEKNPFDRATVAYAVFQQDTDVLLNVTYPSDGKPIRACAVLHAPEDQEVQQDGVELARHCWTPTNDISDFDVWKDFVFGSGREYFIVMVDMKMPDGSIRTQIARPIYGRDS